MAYEQKIHIPFDEGDPGGIVFFGNYYRITHRVFEEYLRSLNIPWEAWFKNPKWAVPLRKSQADYLAPLFPGQAYTVSLQISRLGESSVSFEFQIFNEDQVLCSRVETTHVFIDPKRKRKMKIPAPLKKKLQDSQS